VRPTFTDQPVTTTVAPEAGWLALKAGPQAAIEATSNSREERREKERMTPRRLLP
jgi:hypothetical protein